jgi:hypothetical protein
MKKWAMGITGTALFAGSAMAADVNTANLESVTFTKDILPIMQERCQECHRPGQIGPFSLMNYRQVRGWSKMIQEVTNERRMPPWSADADLGVFKNDRSLKPEELAKLNAWIENGMPQGDPADAPEPVQWNDEWRIGTPDVIFDMPEEVTIEATGVVPYKFYRTPTNFTEDKYIKAMEAKAGNPKVVHHILMFVLPPGAEGRFRGDDAAVSEFQGIGNGFLTGFAPGTIPVMFEGGEGIIIPAGSSLLWQMHYTPTGKVETDRSQFGMIFSDTKPETLILEGGIMAPNIQIPPHAEHYVLTEENVVPRNAWLRSMTPHSHYRGKSWFYELELPDGSVKPLMNVSKYDFNWQITYELAEPVYMPKGSKLRATAVYDNSANNPYNPDPDKLVTWGDQTWEEMMIGFFSFHWADDEQGTD